MRELRLSAWLPLAAGLAVLLSALAFLLVKAELRGDSDHSEHIALVKHLKQVDAQWELEVLQSRIGIANHYDRLAATVAELEGLLARIETVTDSHEHGISDLVAPSKAALVEATAEKAALIEQFKSSNALLRNSLAFLPSAIDDLQMAGTPTPTLASANKLLLATMLYSQNVTNTRAAEIQADLARLETESAKLWPGARERLDVFATHVRTVLREQRAVDGLLLAVAAVPTAKYIDRISDELASDHRREEVRQRQHAQALLGLAVASLTLLLYAVYHVVRGRGLLGRMNRALHSANEHLEQRVQERTEELRQAQSELVAAARQAGMAEIATSVLHNVGNILNSVNVSATLVCSTLRESKAVGLGRAVQLMGEHPADLGDYLTHDPKGRLLPAYLGGLADMLARERQGMLLELEHLTRSIDHIKEVVATQQSYAVGCGVIEPVQVCELAEDALRMNRATFSRRQLAVVKEFAEVPVARLDRGRVLQILVNLISNANNAMANMPEEASRLTLKVEALGKWLRVTVRDEGEGIPPENITRIFSHGFTTRKTGHGFGLHSSALAARQMGGTLTAHSDGPNRGATFTLELPLDGALAGGAAP